LPERSGVAASVPLAVRNRDGCGYVAVRARANPLLHPRANGRARRRHSNTVPCESPSLHEGSPLIDRQLPIGRRQGQDGHGGGVAGAGSRLVAAALGPGAVALLEPEEGVVEVFGELVPVLGAELEHALGTIVDSIVEEAVGVAVAEVAEDPVARGEVFFGAVASAEFEAGEKRSLDRG